jgi:hypothetical protein
MNCFSNRQKVDFLKMSSKKFQKMTLKKGTLGGKMIYDLDLDLDLFKKGDLDMIFDQF